MLFNWTYLFSKKKSHASTQNRLRLQKRRTQLQVEHLEERVVMDSDYWDSVVGFTGGNENGDFIPEITPPVSAVTTSGAFNAAGWTGSVTGTDDSSSGVVSVAVIVQRSSDGESFSGPAILGNGTWSFSLAATDLADGETYTVSSLAIDAVGNVSTVGAGAFEYDTTPPISAVTTAGVFESGGWTGSVIGTDSDTFSGVASVALAIQRNGDSDYWNGTTWQTSSAMVPADLGSGVWSYALAEASLTAGETYTVTSSATDAAGNVQSTADSNTFEYGSITSTVAVAWADGTSTTYDGLRHSASADWSSADGASGALTVAYVGINGTNYASSTSAPTDAGDYEASASFAGDTNHPGSSGSADFTINKASFTYTIANDGQTYGNPADLSHDLGATLSTGVNGENLNISYSSAGDTAVASPGIYPLTGVLADETGALSNYSVTLNNGAFTVDKANPIVSWNLPGPISDLIPLSGVQLDASANLPGSFTYSPAAGTVLTAGTRALSVTFMPTDTTDFNTAFDTVAIVVVGSGETVSGGTLYIAGGSSTPDSIQISSAGSSHTGSTGLQVSGSLNGVYSSKAYSQPFTAIVITDGNGNDNIQLAANLTVSFTLTAGNGNDTIISGNGASAIALGNGNDTVQLGNGANTLILGDGSDNVLLGSGNSVVTLGNGNDSFHVGNGNNSALLGDGNDAIVLGKGNNSITAGNGSDNLGAGNGNNTVILGNGNDSLQFGNGTNVVTVGDGNDNVLLGNGANMVSLGNGADNLQVGTGNNVVIVGNGRDNISAGNGNDVFTAGNGDDNFQLGNGNNTVTAGNGNVGMNAGKGNNTVTLGNGNDALQFGNGNNVVTSGNGTNSINAGNGNNLIAAGLGLHSIQVGNGSNILIDGSVSLTMSGDTLRQVLNDWITNGTAATNVASIRARLAVTYNTNNANRITTGNGLEWFWTTYSLDTLNPKIGDLLN